MPAPAIPDPRPMLTSRQVPTDQEQLLLELANRLRLDRGLMPEGAG